MKLPSAEHPIVIEPHAGRVVVRLGGEVVADTTAALCLEEGGYPPVYYLPRADLRVALSASPRTSHCPYKGEASYWHLAAGGSEAADAAWSYEQPYPAVAAIAGHLAFYPDRVDAIEVS